jgi:hypothetical protein
MREQVQERLPSRPRIWLVAGVAGFIDSHLLEVPEEQGDWSRVHHA